MTSQGVGAQCSATMTHNSKKSSDHKAAITLGVIMGTFLFCWTPFFVINVTGAFCACVPPLLFNALTWLGYVNSMANPVIYPVFNQDFRAAFKRILCTPTCFNYHSGSRKNLAETMASTRNSNSTGSDKWSKVAVIRNNSHNSKPRGSVAWSEITLMPTPDRCSDELTSPTQATRTGANESSETVSLLPTTKTMTSPPIDDRMTVV